MDPKVLIIGASGFIGQNLIKEFENRDLQALATSRHPEEIIYDSDCITTAHLDLNSPTSIKKNLKDVEVIYYLAHAMGNEGDSFKERERIHAKNLAKLLTDKHRLIYLGGISSGSNLSQHLQSRKEVGEIFRESPAQTIEFQASIVIGKGSASFEMIRALVYRLPFIISADWANAPCQPISIKDIVSYLVFAKDATFKQHHLTYEVGGSDVMSYKALLSSFAYHENLVRPEIKISKLPKNLAKEVMKIVIPEYYQVGAKLLDSIEIPTTVQNNAALEKFGFTPMSYSEALKLAEDESLKDVDQMQILDKLGTHPEIPKFLVGQSLQTTVSYKEVKQFETLAERVSSILPKRLVHYIGDEIFLNVPMVGEIKIINNKNQKYLYMAYKPRFFFQATSWILFERLVKEVKKLRS